MKEVDEGEEDATEREGYDATTELLIVTNIGDKNMLQILSPKE